MKKLFLLAVLSISMTAFSQHSDKAVTAPPAGNAMVGDTYGDAVSQKALTKAVSTKKIAKKLNKKGKISDVAVKGKVTEVCEKKGCWLTVETENNERFFVKMKDYAFFVPTALKGKEVVMEGRAELNTISVDEAKHYAQDAKKSKEEIDAITTPQKEVRFVANGIQVVK